MYRSLLAAILAGTTCTASGQSIKVIETVTDAQGNTQYPMAQAISPNHKYLVGSSMNYDEMLFGVFIYDTETETATCVAQDGSTANSATSVTDDGVACGNNDYAMTVGTDGKMTRLDVPEGCTASAKDMTADAAAAVGYYANETDFMTHACIWKNGKVTDLPEPTEEEVGGPVMGSEAQFVSADASVILGVVNNQNYTPCAVAWILQDDGTYKCDLFYQDYFSADGSDASKPYIYVRPMGLSANGKYASITLVTMTGQNIARYDIANRKLDVYEPDGSDGIEAGTVFESSAIADDGKMACLMFTGTGMFQQQAAAVWDNNGESPYILSDKYPELAQLASYADGGYPTLTDITPDGRYIAGYASGTDGNYKSFIIDLGDVTTGISNAAAGTNGNAETARYTIDGTRTATPVNGLNIIRTSDGSTVKVMVK